MNQLHIGSASQISLRGRRRFLYINDEIPPAHEFKDAKVFDLSRHSFNPLQNAITPISARLLADALYAAFPQGENTLTVRNGRRALAPALLEARRLDLVTGDDEVYALIKDILFSPLVTRVLCSRTNFSLSPTSAIFLRLNRAEIGDFDALILGLVFINAFKGQLIIPDFGFYGRTAHINLIRQNRLIAGLNYLDEVPLPLRSALLSIKDKRARGALYDDAVKLALFAGYIPHTNEFNDEITALMSY